MNQNIPKKKSSMRFQQFNQLVDEVVPKLPTLQGLVLLICWRHANENGRLRLSVSRMQRHTGKSRRQIQRTLHALVERKALRIVETAKGTASTVYVITGKVSTK